MSHLSQHSTPLFSELKLLNSGCHSLNISSRLPPIVLAIQIQYTMKWGVFLSSPPEHPSLVFCSVSPRDHIYIYIYIYNKINIKRVGGVPELSAGTPVAFFSVPVPRGRGHPLGKLNLHILARVGPGTTCNHVVMVFGRLECSALCFQ